MFYFILRPPRQLWIVAGYFSILYAIIAAGKLESYFSRDYFEARKRFVEATARLNAQKDQGYSVQTLRHSQTGMPDLTIDGAVIEPGRTTAGAKARPMKLLMITSGVHGSEAPLGSALQLAFFNDVLPALDITNLRVVVLHALNPHGFVSRRRVTENNVDLNRNFMVRDEDYQNTENPGYEKFRYVLTNPQPINHPFLETTKIAYHLSKIAFSGEAASQELRQAFAGGQYKDPQGIYYGGQKPEYQVPWFGGELEKWVKGVDELLLWDIHTGLGKARALQLISGLKTDVKDPRVVELHQGLGDDARVVSPHTKGFYVTTGDFIDYVFDKTPGLKYRTTFTAEFGTLGDDIFGQLATSSRMILENRGHQWGYGSKAAEESVKQQFAELFNPTSLTWRRGVMEIGIRTMQHVFSRYAGRRR